MKNQHVRIYYDNLDKLLKLNGNAYKVYIAILKFSPNPFPSFEKLGSMTGLSRSTVIRQIQYLEERRFLEIIRTHGRVNHYKLLIEPVSVVTPTSVSCDTGTSVSGDTRSNTILSNSNIYGNFYEFLNTQIQSISDGEVGLKDFEHESFIDICNKYDGEGLRKYVQQRTLIFLGEPNPKERASLLIGDIREFSEEKRRLGRA